jgi:hypothetical protein
VKICFYDHVKISVPYFRHFYFLSSFHPAVSDLELLNAHFVAGLVRCDAAAAVGILMRAAEKELLKVVKAGPQAAAGDGAPSEAEKHELLPTSSSESIASVGIADAASVIASLPNLAALMAMDAAAKSALVAQFKSMPAPQRQAVTAHLVEQGAKAGLPAAMVEAVLADATGAAKEPTSSAVSGRNKMSI